MILAIGGRLFNAGGEVSEVMLMVTVERGEVTRGSPLADVPSGSYVLEYYFRKPYRAFIRIENGVIVETSTVPEREKSAAVSAQADAVVSGKSCVAPFGPRD